MADTKTWLGQPDKWARLKRIEALDMDKDWLEIGGLTSADFLSIIFPVPFAGFMTTFAAPRMSRILASTGELTNRVAKRAVDTILFSSTLHTHGFGTPEGRKAARKVNALHAQYDIHPDDFIAVGCDPLIFTLDLFDRYGWRDLLPKEREAQRLYYDRQARAFGSRKPLPKTEEEMRDFIDNYFETQLWYEPQNQEMAEKTLDWYVELAPRPLRGLFRKILLSTLDSRVVEACGLKASGPVDRAISHVAMKALASKDPVPDGRPDMLKDLVNSVYPDGYTIDDLGPKLKDPAPDGAACRTQTAA